MGQPHSWGLAFSSGFPEGTLTPEGGAWQAADRLLRKGARLVAILFSVVLLGAAVYEHVGAWRDSRVLKQIGRSVDIGGRTLNIYCTGEGSPTVIFVSARTAPGYVWTPTQRGVSAFTRACWYNRADLGWSDAGPDPAWGDAAARDLHRLVQNAGLRPPLVLVGHSFGGYVSRLYHHAYPGEASGMVFVDTALEDAGTIHGMPSRKAADSAFGDSWPLDGFGPAWNDPLLGG